jgi:hypothetical protein
MNDGSEAFRGARGQVIRDQRRPSGLMGRGDVRRWRIALGGVAIGLTLWLILSADKPWKFDLTRAAQWNLGAIVGFYSFWAGVFNLALVAVLIGTARWWAEVDRTAPGASPERRLSPIFWIAVIGAMAFTGILSAKRLNFGLAHDEDLSARRAIVGEYKLADDGQVLPPKLKWQNTFFDYRKPTNHVFYSLLARTAWATHGLFAGPEGWHIREWVIRLPAWLAGILGVLALALLAAKLGGELAGITSAWLLAVHPWYLRYASEARGYSLLLFILPVALLLWLRATRDNLWRWWLALGLCQFLIVWVYPAAIYILFVLNVLTALWLANEWREQPGDRRWRRWLAINLMSAMAANQMMLPLIPQLLNYLRTAPEARNPLTLSWLTDTSSNLFVGACWNKSGSLSSPYVELATRAHEHPVLFVSLLVAIGVAAVTGTLRLLRWRWPRGAIVACTLLLPAMMAATVAKITNQWLFEWYSIYLLPGLIAVTAIGVGHESRGVFKLPLRVLTAAIILLAYAVFSEPVRERICARPLDPIKEVVTSMRGTLKPNAQTRSERLTASFPNHLSYYDPHVQRLKTATDLRDAMQRADREDKPLSVTAYHPWGVVFGNPDVWRLFYESGLFTDFVVYHGVENLQDRVVARYQPGAIEGFDMEAFLRGKQAVPDPMRPPIAYPQKPIYAENSPAGEQ